MFTKERTNICKGVAALFLLFHHLFTEKRVELYDIQFLIIPQNWGVTIATLMRVCVRMFVFLSAYGLTYKYMHRKDDSSPISFVRHQWLSLMKQFWIVFLITILVYYLTGHSVINKYEGNLLYFLLDGFGLSDMFETPHLFGAYWYICLAQVLICFVPLIYEITKRFGYLTIIISFLVLQFITAGIGTQYGGSYQNYLLAIICGSVFATENTLNRLSSKTCNIPTRVLYCLALIMISVVSLYLKHKTLSENDIRGLRFVYETTGAVSICLLFGIYIQAPILNKVLKFLGQYSGSVYLLHLIFYGYLSKIVYISRYPLVVWMVLIAESYLAAFLLDKFKRLIHYDKWMIIKDKRIDKK